MESGFSSNAKMNILAEDYTRGELYTGKTIHGEDRPINDVTIGSSIIVEFYLDSRFVRYMAKSMDL